MKQVLSCLLLVLLLCSSGAEAQNLRFEKDSLGRVLQRARQQQKPVFVLLTSPTPAQAATLTPQQREQRYGTGLDDEAVRQLLEKEFLLVHAAFSSPDARRLSSSYGINTYPTYLYLHPDGTVLHRSFSNTRDPQRYLHDINQFRQKLARPDNLSRLEQRYAQGERGGTFLRQYIEARRGVGSPISAALLDEYVQELPVKAFSRLREVAFVHECGPVVGSRAYTLARLNKLQVDSLYQTLPLARRIEFNNLIIRNTMREAIATRNESLAQQGASFARGTWGIWKNDPQRGSQAYDQHMLSYFQALRDTARYLPWLVSFYDRHYMRQPADTVRQRRNREQTARFAANQVSRYPNLARPDSTVNMVQVKSSTTADVYALELNNGAWAVYTSGTHNPTYLTAALTWSRRTIDLDPRAAYYDTLAHLLYALRFYAEAEAMQANAVARAKQEGQPQQVFQEALRKIKSRTL